MSENYRIQSSMQEFMQANITVFSEKRQGAFIRINMVYSDVGLFLSLTELLQLQIWTTVKPVLKGYCTVFQHALNSLEITGIVLS